VYKQVMLYCVILYVKCIVLSCRKCLVAKRYEQLYSYVTMVTVVTAKSDKRGCSDYCSISTNRMMLAVLCLICYVLLLNSVWL
jgi:hypothetical protein